VPVVTNQNSVVLAFRDGFVRSFGLETGVLTWETFVGKNTLSSPAADNAGSIYVGGRNPVGCYKLDGTTGDVVWHIPLGQGISSSPALSSDENMVYLGKTREDPGLYAFNTDDGSQISAYTIDGEIGFSSPVIGKQGLVYQLDPRQGLLYAMTLTEGTLQVEWKLKVEGSDAPRLVTLDEDSIYVSTYDDENGHIMSVSLDGEPKWNHTFKVAQLTAPVVTTDVIYVGTDTNLMCLDKTDGSVLWEKPVTPKGCDMNDPVLGSNGVLYVGVSGTFSNADSPALLAIDWTSSDHEETQIVQSEGLARDLLAEAKRAEELRMKEEEANLFRKDFQGQFPRPAWWDSVSIDGVKIRTLDDLWSVSGEHHDKDRRVVFKAAYQAILYHPFDEEIVVAAIEHFPNYDPKYPHLVEILEFGLNNYFGYRSDRTDPPGTWIASITESLATRYIFEKRYSDAISIIDRLFAEYEGEVNDHMMETITLEYARALHGLNRLVEAIRVLENAIKEFEGSWEESLKKRLSEYKVEYSKSYIETLTPNTGEKSQDKEENAVQDEVAKDEPSEDDLSSPKPKVREWWDAKGKHSVKAELVNVEGRTVTLKKANGKSVSLPITKLSEADRRYLESFVTSTAKKASLTVIYPNGGEEIERLKEFEIRWRGENLGDRVRILIQAVVDSEPRGSFPVVQEAENDGSHVFKIPLSWGYDDFIVRIKEVNGPGNDESDEVFKSPYNAVRNSEAAKEGPIAFHLEPHQKVMGPLVNYFRPLRIQLETELQEELVAEPDYASEKPLYGTMQLGDGSDNLITLVVDEAEGEAPRIYVDRNNDEDLTNDGSGEWSRSGSMLGLSGVAIDVAYESGTVPYTFEFYRFTTRLQDFVLYYRNAGREGEIASGSERYTVVALDENADGRFDDLDNGTLIIDLNQDGKLVGHSDSAEHHKLNEPFNIHGRVWEVASLSPDGKELQLRPSEAPVEMKRYLDPGYQAPAFTGKDLDDNTINLAKDAADAKYVLLDFWASWCGPCRTEYPYLRRMHAQYKDHGLRIIGINLDSDRDKAVQAADENLLTYPHVFDGGGWKNAAAVLYRVHGIPATYLLDQDLNIVAKSLQGSALEKRMTELLGPGDTKAAAEVEEAVRQRGPGSSSAGRPQSSSDVGQQVLSDSQIRDARSQFESVTFSQVKGADFSTTKVNGSSTEDNQLLPGTVLAARTNQGQYVKLMIEEYGYNLVISWVTYDETGEVHSKGTDLKIRGTRSYDLDSGQEAKEDADLWWEQVDKTERYLVPTNNALFVVLGRGVMENSADSKVEK
jgi:outer membrane protein assembly factor BamB/thiol-disulfide isomerase/thioredoxin